MRKILVVDDDPGLRQVVLDALERAGHDVVLACDGADALDVLRECPVDLMVTDVAMPELGGEELVRATRERSDIPILVLTVRSSEEEKVRLLDAGADDYVVKPFGVAELLARVRVLLRRMPGNAAERLTFGELSIDLPTRRVELSGQEVHLTPTEFGLLAALARKPGTVCTVKQLTSAVWGDGADVSRDTIRVHVGSLRKKLEPEPAVPRWIRTEPWVGYRFTPDVSPR